MGSASACTARRCLKTRSRYANFSNAFAANHGVATQHRSCKSTICAQKLCFCEATLTKASLLLQIYDLQPFDLQAERLRFASTASLANLRFAYKPVAATRRGL